MNMKQLDRATGYTEEDLRNPHFIAGSGYRSVPGYPHIHILADGAEVYNAKTGRALSIWSDSDGYPNVTFSGRNWRVQRLVLAAWHPGCLDDGSMALHKAPRRDCVAVWNLRPGTHAENMRDRLRDGNDPNVNKRLCPVGHPLVGENLRRSELARGKRSCRACNSAKSKVRAAKRRGVNLSDKLRHIADQYADQYLADTFLPLPLTPVDVLQRRVDAVTSIEWCD